METKNTWAIRSSPLETEAQLLSAMLQPTPFARRKKTQRKKLRASLVQKRQKHARRVNRKHH